jgi:hypothetical protein
MSSPKPIGGFFELENSAGDTVFNRTGAILLNSGRSCFEYILKSVKPNRVYFPKYTCDVMLEPLSRQGIDYVFYELDERLELAKEISLKDDEMLVYTNYFGVKDGYSKKMIADYGNQLVLDCAQAFYFEPTQGSNSFSSPRKFFGLPDGGILYTYKLLDEDIAVDTSSTERMSHLYKRSELGPEAAYADFKTNDAALSSKPMLGMSELTRRILGSIDFEAAKKIRHTNFKYLHKSLGARNKLELETDNACPMVYPFMSDDEGLKQKLIAQKIFVPTYWPNVFEWAKPEEIEYQIARSIIPLPIDQRYDDSDMKRIVEAISEG